jgi:hypothetical protein
MWDETDLDYLEAELPVLLWEPRNITSFMHSPIYKILQLYDMLPHYDVLPGGE